MEKTYIFNIMNMQILQVEQQRITISYISIFCFQVNWKCWDKSPHVGHFRVHKKEYLEILDNHLQDYQSQQKESVKIKAEI